MRRNSFGRLLKQAERSAARQALTPAALTAPTSSSTTGQNAGTVDSLTGEWGGFGLLDVTPLADFRTA